MNRLQEPALRLFVKRLMARSVLTEEEVDALLGLSGRLAELPIHKEFAHVGQPVDHVCLLVAGLIGRFGLNNLGARQITCLYVPGDMADLPSVVSPTSAWGLVALTGTTILQVAHADLRRLAAQFPGIADALWRDCVADGSIFSEWVVNVGRRNAITRIAHLFCEMAIRCEQADLGDRHSFLLPITQADLADATGLTAIHVSRTLKELRALHAVDLRAGTVTIDDWDRLTKIGDFDPAFMLLTGSAPRITAAA